MIPQESAGPVDHGSGQPSSGGPSCSISGRMASSRMVSLTGSPKVEQQYGGPMATSETVDWDVCARCAAEDGIGVRLPNSENCWAHADGQDVAAALKRLSEEGSIDARGVPLTSELLERMLATAPHNDQGRPVLTEVRCDQARFEGALRLRGTIFEGPAVFNEATFEGLAEFNDATFQGMAWFIGATFN